MFVSDHHQEPMRRPNSHVVQLPRLHMYLFLYIGAPDKYHRDPVTLQGDQQQVETVTKDTGVIIISTGIDDASRLRRQCFIKFRLKFRLNVFADG